MNIEPCNVNRNSLRGILNQNTRKKYWYFNVERVAANNKSKNKKHSFSKYHFF